ncbi:MAG: TonB-dependent receptor [bacterium]|nr:TonB-dependent receptor [bacterium]
MTAPTLSRNSLSSTAILSAAIACVMHPALAQQQSTPGPGSAPPDSKAASADPDGQDPSTTKPVIVTATRIEEDPFDVPFTVESIGRETMRQRSYRTVPQVLRDVPGVMVQETAHGHGSPYIRGFTSFRNLFLIDGIRLNNSAFRPGPNQYWNTVDPYSIDRLEIVKGPSSVLYGSDAIGGTVNVITKDPYTYGDNGINYGGASYVRFSTAENSVHARGEVSVGYTHADGSRTGVLFGGSAKNFGDLEGGRGVGTQPETGYQDNAFDIKIEHWFDADTRLVFLHQNLMQDDVPRTHRTVNGITWRGVSSGSDLQRNFDQNRYLTYVQYHKENIDGPVNAVRANLSFHQQVETRDRVRGSGAQEEQGFDVGTTGAWVQFESNTSVGHFTYGIEIYHDDVNSFLRRQTPQVGDEIQGPIANDSTYDLIGVYVQDQIQLADNLDVNLGARFTYAAADANSARDPVGGGKIALDDSWDAVVGNARIRYEAVPDQVAIFGGVSQGFRAPNLSDLTRFDTARSGEFEIPAPNLDPENYIQYEIGTKVETDDASVQLSYFYTDIEDQILRFPTGNVNASMESEVTKGNVGDGHIEGVEFGGALRVTDETTVFGNATWLYGRLTNFESGGSALANTFPTRLMPLTIQAGVRFDDAEGLFWAETAVVHAEDADKLSFGDLRDSSRIPPGGTPGFTVWHIRGGVNVSDNTTIDVLLENITDVDYRIHGSGQNRPGRNLIIGCATTF